MPTPEQDRDVVRHDDTTTGDLSVPEGKPDGHTEGPSVPMTRGQVALAVLKRMVLPGVVHLAFAFVVALCAQTVLEITRTGLNWPYLITFAQREVGVLAMGTTVLMLIVLALMALTGRMWISGTLVLGLAGLLGVASHLKFMARREPIYPRDLAFMLEPKFLVGMVQPGVLWKALVGLLALAAFTFVLSWLCRLLLRRRAASPVPPRWRVAVLGTRLAVVAVSVLLLSSLLQFNHHGNSWRRAFESSGARWAKASQPHNYKANGFLGGFLYNLDIPAMTKPAGYSRATIDEIMAKYTTEAERTNVGRNPAALDDVNVVTVLEESFSDPTRLNGIELGEDPLPRTRALMKKLPHGQMLSYKLGGGTSSMEFEALTGMSLSQFNSAMDTPYQMLIPGYQSFPSVVELFNQLNHETLAIHPFSPTMYQRDHVYPILGFQDFISLRQMDYRSRQGRNPFISDHASFMQTLAAIESHADPVFVNLVTMQNHTPYTGKYDNPVEVKGLSPSGAEMMGQYSRGVRFTDQAIANFIKQLDASDEKTVVLLYGDHLPAGIPGKLFKKNDGRTLHETPFFIYSNFSKLPAKELPTTSPIFFMPQLFDMVGAPLPPYFALLRDLQNHVSALEHGRIFTAEGQEAKVEDLSPEARQVLRDYRLVQYDLAVGKRYAEKMLYPVPSGTVRASTPSE